MAKERAKLSKEQEKAINDLSTAIEVASKETINFLVRFAENPMPGMPPDIYQATALGACLAVLKKYIALIPAENQKYVEQGEKFCEQIVNVVDGPPLVKPPRGAAS